MNALQTITDDIYSVREQFLSVCSDAPTFEREAGFAVQLLSANDYSMRVAMDNRQSVMNAVANIAAIGISLNPAKKQAYLVPRDGRICLDISYMGLLDLAIASGSIKWGQAALVHAGDRFELNGFDKPPTHARDPFSKERGEVIGVYVVVKTSDGDYLTETMTIAEVFDIRDRSASWKAWISKQKKCPWVTDEGEMVKKTVIKRAYKLWPKTDKLDTAVHYLNTEGGEGLAELAQTEAPAKTTIHKPTAGAMESLSPEQQDYIRQVADDVLEAFQVAGPEQALIRCEIEDFDADRVVALWSRLPSNVRSAIKKAKIERDAKATA